jgi:hypothetical protein
MIKYHYPAVPDNLLKGEPFVDETSQYSNDDFIQSDHGESDTIHQEDTFVKIEEEETSQQEDKKQNLFEKSPKQSSAIPESLNDLADPILCVSDAPAESDHNKKERYDEHK